jgi:hypothetical protein
LSVILERIAGEFETKTDVGIHKFREKLSEKYADNINFIYFKTSPFCNNNVIFRVL